MKEYWLLLVILVIHITLSVFFLAFRFERLRQRKEYLLPILLLPVFGPLMALTIDLLVRFGKQGTRRVDLEALRLENEIHWSPVKKLAEDKNVIPLEEAILISDIKSRRKAVLDTFRRDPFHYLNVLMVARGNEDVDTTHYATIQITKIQRQFQVKLQEMADAYEKDPNNDPLLDEYIELLGRYIDSSLPEDLILKRQQVVYARLLNKKLSIARNDRKTLMRKLRNCIQLEEFGTALEVVEVLKNQWPNDEQTWIEALRLCVERHDHDQLQQTIREMQSADIAWTRQGRATISPWVQAS